MNVFWEETELPEFPSLNENIKTDVLIIGGGMAGLLCAYYMKNAGISCVLVEENRICSGVTGRTTAKITAQHGEIYQRLMRNLGIEKARQYYEANEAALAQFEKLCKEIACDYETADSFLYRRENREKLEKEMLALEKLGASVWWTEQTELPFSVVGAIGVANQARFHPLQFAAGIGKNLPIYEHTEVLQYDGKEYLTEFGRIRAEKTVIATHFPMWNKHGLYPVKLYQDRSYVLALENVPAIQGMYRDGDPKGLSFRQADKYLLLGGGAHRTGKKSQGWPEREARQFYPESKVAFRWATQDCITLDGLPYIGQYAPSTPNLYVATGFNKWGMTGSMVAAQLLTDLVQGRENPYRDLFYPGRGILRPQLAVNAFEAVTHLVKPTVPRCPHMGCALKWNRRERSWDCACHGSRFSEDGTRLNHPASGDLKGIKRH